MARRIKNRKKADETLVDIVEVRDQAQGFFEKNQRLVFGLGVALIVIFGGLLFYKNFYQAPREAEAIDQMNLAQYMFERDSFAQALTSPGVGSSGFLDIIKNYGGTEAGNLANYYAGISYLNLGEFEAALDYLESYKPGGEILPVMKYGAIGDAHSELGQMDKALSSYERAVRQSDNSVLTSYYLKKLGMLHEKQGDTEAAREAYERVKTEFPESPYATDIDKYLTRVADAAGNG